MPNWPQTCYVWSQEWPWVSVLPASIQGLIPARQALYQLISKPSLMYFYTWVKWCIFVRRFWRFGRRCFNSCQNPDLSSFREILRLFFCILNRKGKVSQTWVPQLPLPNSTHSKRSPHTTVSQWVGFAEFMKVLLLAGLPTLFYCKTARFLIILGALPPFVRAPARPFIGASLQLSSRGGTDTSF